MNIKVFISSVILMVAAGLPAMAMEFQFQFASPGIDSVSADLDMRGGPENYSVIQVKDLPLAGHPGQPLLPHKPLTILLPPGTSLRDVSVTSGSWTVMPGEYMLYPSQHSAPLSEIKTLAPTPPDPLVYASRSPLPVELHSPPAVYWSKGYQLLCVNLFPIRYTPSTGHLEYTDQLTLRLSLTASEPPSAVMSCRATPTDQSWIRSKVINPGMVDRYTCEAARERDDSQYVIITTSAIQAMGGPNNFQDFLSFKLSRGITGTIKTVESIYAEYSGSNNQEKIRNFIRDAYQTMGTEYVLLGGDTAQVPARGCYATAEGHEDSTIPTDMYYGCLDGPWDYNGNNVYGEIGDGLDGGDVDVFAEVFIGRASIDTMDQLHNFVGKTIAYETDDYSLEWADNALLLGEYLWPETYGGDYMDELWYGSSAFGYTTPGYPGEWDIDHLYERESSWGSSELTVKLNTNNVFWVNHLGHASETSVMQMYSSAVDSLSNSRPFLVYSQGCYAGAFDTGDCIAEHFSWAEGAAFAVLMNGRYGWGEIGCTDGPSQYFHRQFHDAYFTEGIREIGRMNQDSKEDNVWCLDYKANRWVCYEMNLLGCPQTPINGRITSRGQIAFDKNRYHDGDTIIVAVRDVDLNLSSGTPDTATVALSVNAGLDTESLLLVETDNSSCVFTGSIPVTQGLYASGDGTVQVAEGDDILGVYIDESDGFGGTDIPVTVAATADFTPPVITNVLIYEYDDSSVLITWDTSEPCTGTVVYDTATPPGTFSQSDSGYTINHEIRLTGLTACTDYYFYVESTDQAGISVTDTQGGSYYSITTMTRIFLLDEPMDSNPGWTITGGDWQFGQPTGQPQGPGADPDSGFDGPNVYGTNLNGAYTGGSPYHLVTPPIDCSGSVGTRLSFYRWLAVDAFDDDEAYVSVSTDGTTWADIYENPMSNFYEYRWEYVSYDISGLVDGENSVYIRWTMGPAGSGSVGGWNIDNVSVSFPAPCNLPYLVHDSHTIDDSSGNSDGAVNPTESIEMDVTLRNIGLDATGITATLSSSYPHVTITSGAAGFADVPQSGVGGSTSPFGFDVHRDASDGEMIPFDLAWISNESSGITRFSHEIIAPLIQVDTVMIIDDSTGDGDGILDPGESAYLMVGLRNTGRLAAGGVTAVISSDHPEYITLDDDTAEYPDLAAGSTEFCLSPYFAMTTDPSTPDHTLVTVTVTVDAINHTSELQFEVDVTTSTFARRYLWNLDTGPSEWEFEGQWEYGEPMGSGGDPSSGFTGTNVLGYNLAGTYTNNMSELALTSSAINCSNFENVEVRFMRWLGVESASYDHAEFLVSSDNATWHSVWDHEGSTLEENDWLAVSYDISSFADNQGTVYLRWTMGPTDGSVVKAGWNIDDIEIWAEMNNPAPALVYVSHTIDDSAGVPDGHMNPAEIIDLSVTAQNLGIAGSNFDAFLSSPSSDVSVTVNQAAFPDMPSGSTGQTLTPFTLEISDTVGDGQAIPLTITWSSDEGNGTFNFSEEVYAPSIQLDHVSVNDGSSGDMDGILDPGETVDLEITLHNGGRLAATGVSAVLTTDHSSQITVIDGSADFPDIPQNNSATSLAPHFQLSADSSIPDPTTITVTLAISSDHYSGVVTFQLPVTTSTFCRRISWSMDDDPQWTTEGQWAWGIPQGLGGDPTSGADGDFVYGYNLAGTYSNDMNETSLTSTAIDCSSFTDVELRFKRWLGVESASYDHAYIRISTDGTSWQTIWDHTGGTMEETSWSDQSLDISLFADGEDTVFLRWVMGETDGSVVKSGWNIDEVEIWANPVASPPTATPTWTQQPSPTPSPSPNPTGTPAPTPPPTATADPTATIPPSPTPPPATPTPLPNTGIRLIMEDTELAPGDRFFLQCELANGQTASLMCDTYILLEVYGMFWCWPSWCDLATDLDYTTQTVDALSVQVMDILDFTWPNGAGSADGLHFFGAIFDAGTFNLIGSMTTVEWGYR